MVHHRSIQNTGLTASQHGKQPIPVVNCYYNRFNIVSPRAKEGCLHNLNLIQPIVEDPPSIRFCVAHFRNGCEAKRKRISSRRSMKNNRKSVADPSNASTKKSASTIGRTSELSPLSNPPGGLISKGSKDTPSECWISKRKC